MQTRQGLAALRTNQLALVDGEVKFTRIIIGTPLYEQLAASRQKSRQMKDWQEYVNDLKEDCPSELKGGVFVTSERWPWMDTEEAFYQSAVQGITMAIIFSFCVMFFVTRSIRMSLISISCIFVIVNSIVCIAVMKGWELGVTESLAFVSCIGLSVDYVVHLAAEYIHSKHKSRYKKMRQAYERIGISISFGALTSIGAAAFQLGCVLPIGHKFAVLLTSTLSISCLTSFLLFGALCHTVGLENGDHEEDEKDINKGCLSRIKNGISS